MMSVNLTLPDQETVIQVIPGQQLNTLEEQIRNQYDNDKRYLFCLQSLLDAGHYCLILNKIPLGRQVDQIFVEPISQTDYDRKIVQVSVVSSSDEQDQVAMEVATEALMEEVDILYKSYTGQNSTAFLYYLHSDPLKKSLTIDCTIESIKQSDNTLKLVAQAKVAHLEIIELPANKMLGDVELGLEFFEKYTARELYMNCWELFETKQYDRWDEYIYKYQGQLISRKKKLNVNAGDRVKLLIQTVQDPRQMTIKDRQGNEINSKIYEFKSLDMRRLQEIYAMLVPHKPEVPCEIHTQNKVLRNSDFLDLRDIAEREIVMIVDAQEGGEQLLSLSPTAPQKETTVPSQQNPPNTLPYQHSVYENPPLSEFERIKRQLKQLLSEQTPQNTTITNQQLLSLAADLLRARPI